MRGTILVPASDTFLCAPPFAAHIEIALEALGVLIGFAWEKSAARPQVSLAFPNKIPGLPAREQ